MQTVLASTLSNTRVMSTDGQELGTLHNVTFDTAGGNLNCRVDLMETLLSQESVN